MKRLFFVFLFLAHVFANAQNIYTVAGSGYHPVPLIYSGDGGSATAAGLNRPINVFVDQTGNVFIADRDNNVIRKVNTSGVITTIAGTGFAGFLGDGGQATAAQLNGPTGIVVDNIGNLYIVDINNYRIRKVDPVGIISTVAGNGVCCWSSDGGLADTTRIMAVDIALDASGNVFFADSYTNRVRKIAMPSGIISTVAGSGIMAFGGDGGPATSATMHSPTGITLDDTGNLYIVDYNNNRVRKVNTSGVINTIAGSGLYPGSTGDGGLADTATLNHPWDIAIDSLGNIYVSQNGDHRIRKINPFGFISTICGDGTSGFTGDGGPSTAARVYFPKGIVCDKAGNVYFADEDNFRVRKIGSSPLILPTFLSSFEKHNLDVYPNPANDLLYISSPGKISTISICNFTGVTVFSHEYDRENVEVNIDALPIGVYFLKVNSTDVRKFVKL